MADLKDDSQFDGDYARDTHQGGLSGDYAREEDEPGTAAHGDTYATSLPKKDEDEVQSESSRLSPRA